MSERIERVAIKRMDTIWSVPRPGRHHDVIAHMHAKHPFSAHEGIQGFVTDAGRFVDRHEACKIARKAGQIKTKTQPEDELFSEDMW